MLSSPVSGIDVDKVEIGFIQRLLFRLKCAVKVACELKFKYTVSLYLSFSKSKSNMVHERLLCFCVECKCVGAFG